MAKEKMKNCAVCGQPIADGCKTCPHCGAKNKKPVFKKWWFWLIIVVVIVAIGSAGGAQSATQQPVSGTVGDAGASDSGAANTGDTTPAEQDTTEPVSPDLELVDNSVTEESDGYSLTLTGTVRNNRATDYAYAQITFNLYDADGNQIGTAMDNINNLKAGGTWKFEAMAFDSPDSIASYELAEITGW